MKRLSIALLILISAGSCGAEPVPPNFLFVIVDDLGRQDLAVYGSSFYETPNMDRLAAEGMRFDNAYAAHPRCVPSRLGIMSGRFPARYGIPGFPDRAEGNHALPLSATTFAERLQEAGYRTGYIGKWHLGKEGGDPSVQGFDTAIMAGAPGAPPSYFHPYEKPRGREEAVKWVSYDGGEPGEYLTDRLTQEAIEFIDREKEGPFLLVLAHYAVHTPIQAPEEIAATFRDKARLMELEERWDGDLVTDRTGEVKTQQNHPVYAAMIDRVDAGLGRLIEKLDREGLSDNTVVILTSDHGGLSTRGLGNRRELATTNLPYRHGKGWLFDGGIRVPLLVKWPGHVAPGSVTEVQTTGTDHYASILEMAGLPLQPDVHADSVSYVQALQGEDYARGPMYWHSSLGRPQQTGDTRSSAVIDGPWKLIQWYSLESEAIERVELFHIVDDPGERNDLSASEPQQRQRLETLLNAWKESVNARLGEFRQGGI
jgi:arylsulfatase A-like enzyme